ncbi:FAD-dependent oxidoreductase [Sulfitobacter sp. S190]|uniref:FAD-dependent oxidoreductase n=1 Tax=Sulfitobacter sp. S190 TaxID=2867022 RepID=UPI0021A39AC9|nr:FAD-dependent oxidoreductase [Sulfitobacter sp. S190]UWR23860.1 FAD-dependent oxidoreductase [Sulfitobacter sp. S190]
MVKSALIAGAGVAGPTTAYWLAKHGWDVTVIERAGDLRLGGQNIDITDAARDIVEQMGIETAIKDKHTGEKGLMFVDTDNVSKAEFPTQSKGSLTREIEILRGDLVKIIVDATPESVSYRFDTTIKALDHKEDGVGVTFDDDTTEEFDIVIAADGMNSRTRPMILGEGDYTDYLGVWSSYFTVPRIEADNDWWRWYTSPSGVIAFLRPDNKGTMRASVNFQTDDNDPPHMTLEDKKDRLRARLSGAGWECDRLAKALDDVEDIFLGPLHQIKADSWSHGRSVLVGDAAYCPTPYTGMGTTIAIIGSYILANELATHDDHAAVFAAYEEKFRAFAKQAQKLPPGVPDAAYANSMFKVKLVNSGAALAASTPVQSVLSLFGGGDEEKSNDFDLPQYETARSA